MNFKNSIRILKKDWKGTVRTKEILLPMLLMPALFAVGMPIMMLIGVLIDPEEYANAFGDMEVLFALLQIPESYNITLAATVMMLKMMVLPMFLMIPGIIPAMISSDSFAGEKERKTMESVALLPISKSELIIGKVLASLIPSLIITFFFFGLMGLTVNLMMLEFLDGNILIFTDATIMLTVFVLAPCLALLNILISTIISSRSKDLKSAQSISGALVMPILVLVFVQIFNPAFLTTTSVLVLSLILGGLCIIFIDLANRLLDIEKLILMV